ncbi:hypothetical protein PCE1_004648 [Barthelona sp. PCE]
MSMSDVLHFKANDAAVCGLSTYTIIPIRGIALNRAFLRQKLLSFRTNAIHGLGIRESDIPSVEQLVKRAISSASQSSYDNAQLVIIASPGEAKWGMFGDLGTPHVLMNVIDNTRCPNTISLGTVAVTDEYKVSHRKSMELGWNRLVAHRVQKDGYDDALLYSTDYCVLQGSHNNVFWIKGDQVFTPEIIPGLVFDGISRCIVQTICENLNVDFIEKKAVVEELQQADAIFMGEFKPVDRVDGVFITSKNNALFSALNNHYIEAYAYPSETTGIGSTMFGEQSLPSMVKCVEGLAE